VGSLTVSPRKLSPRHCARVTIQGGSFGNKRFTGDFDQPLSHNVAFRLNGLYENDGSFRNFVSLERYGVNPTLTFTPGTRTKITVSYEYFHDGRVADRGIPSYQGRPADTPISTYFGNPDDSHVRADVHLVGASIEQQWDQLIFHSRTQFGDYDRAYQNYVPGAVTADKTHVAISAYNNATKTPQRLQSNRFDLQLSDRPRSAYTCGRV